MAAPVAWVEAGFTVKDRARVRVSTEDRGPLDMVTLGLTFADSTIALRLSAGEAEALLAGLSEAVASLRERAVHVA